MPAKSTVTQKANGPVAVDIDLDVLGTEVPITRPSVEKDYSLEELGAVPDKEVADEPDYDTVLVAKPKSMAFIYTHPEWRFDVWLLLPGFGQWSFTHIVLEAVARQFPSICRLARLVPYTDQDNGLFLWPMLLYDARGDRNRFTQSALGRIQQAAGRWCRYEADMKQQRYRLYEAPDQKESPRWPDGGLRHMVKVAFRDCVIDRKDHELLGQRLGRVVE